MLDIICIMKVYPLVKVGLFPSNVKALVKIASSQRKTIGSHKDLKDFLFKCTVTT